MIAGRYTLDREIGRGGMGAVWLAHDEVLGRLVALKRIGQLPGVDSPDLARAEREARLAARLNHPHVVAVFNFVVDEETGARWLVMEYVEGTTLARLVREHGPLTADQAAPLLEQVADALAAAHAAGIVHRDVKPSNILLDRERRAKLTDFGIARVATDPSLTQTGLVTGSPAYLAPEVAAGQRGDEAVDVWSLGATIFHVLAGRPPYDLGENVIGGLYRVVHEEPPRLDDAGWMAPLLEGTMAKDPAQRWTMAQVRDFLARPAAGRDRPVPAPVPGPAPAHPTQAGPAQAGSDAPTRTVPAVPGPAVPGAAAPGSSTAAAPPGDATRERPPVPRKVWLGGLAGLVAALLLAAALGGVLSDNGSPDPAAAPGGTASAGSDDPGEDAQEDGPTEQGMASFIRDYVAAVSSNPDEAWQMLTPKFQRESGGLETYRDFWSGVGSATILDISANPDTLAVSYRVRFENFGTGQRPTVLDLVYDDGRYLIDGERTEGFEPAS